MKKYICILLLLIISVSAYTQNFFVFSGNYRIIKMTAYSEKDNSVSETYTFEYDKSGRLVKQITDSNILGVYEVRTNIYDDSGKLIRTDKDSGFKEDKCIIYYTYGTTSYGRSMILTYTYPESDDDYEYCEEYYYNESGLLTQSIYSDMYFSAGNFYEYNNSGKLMIETDNTGVYSTEYIYDDNGRIVRTVQKEMDTENTVSEYLYDSSGRLIYISFDVEIPEFTAEADYDGNGNLSRVRRKGIYGTNYYIIEWEPGTPALKVQDDLFRTGR